MLGIRDGNVCGSQNALPESVCEDKCKDLELQNAVQKIVYGFQAILMLFLIKCVLCHARARVCVCEVGGQEGERERDFRRYVQLL